MWYHVIAGRHYDENGNYVNWWTPKSIDEFQKRTTCFVKQYSKYSLDAGPVRFINSLANLVKNVTKLIFLFLTTFLLGALMINCTLVHKCKFRTCHLHLPAPECSV